jgi:uncharacterized membrane protein
VSTQEEQQEPAAKPAAQPAPDASEGIPDSAQLLVATVGALLIGVLYLVLPEQLTIGPSWLLLVIEAALLALPVISAFFLRRRLPHHLARGLAMGLLMVVTGALVGSLLLLVNNLSFFHQGGLLLRPAALLWGINVLVFAAWYWEIDGGGRVRRHEAGHQAADFLFPQQVGGNRSGWKAGFIDYLFLAFCSATALSPADTMPLTRRAKLLMMVEALISLLIVILLVARAVNIG